MDNTTVTVTVTTNTPVDNVDKATQTDFLSRISNYTLVNSVIQQSAAAYNNLKSVSPIIKAGLETAEGTTHKLVGLAQPVITKLDSALHLDETACKVLDKTEELSSQVASAYQKGIEQSENIKTQIQNNVESAKEVVAKTYNQGSDLLNQTVAASVSTGNRLLVGYANKPLNQILDVTENIVNSILPPELELEPLDIHEEQVLASPPGEKTSATSEQSIDKHLEENPFPRIKQLSGGVGKRVKRVALSKLQNLSFRTPSQVNSMGYVVDLIQYTADYIDLDQKRQAVKDASANIQHYFEDKRDQTVKLVSPVREIIEKQTADVKEQTVKSIVAIVSTIAHTTEVVRRQLIGQVPDTATLQQNLAQITERTKNTVLNLKEPQLTLYINYVRSTYHYALESLLNLTQAYTPSVLAMVDGQLQGWRDSLYSRLSYYPYSSGSSSSKPVEPDQITATIIPATPQKIDTTVVNS